jgi:hypothetical protein
MARPKTPNTAAATEARRRLGLLTKAAALREAGWLVVAPEQVHEWEHVGPDHSPTLRRGRSRGGNGI